MPIGFEIRGYTNFSCPLPSLIPCPLFHHAKFLPFPAPSPECRHPPEVTREHGGCGTTGCEDGKEAVYEVVLRQATLVEGGLAAGKRKEGAAMTLWRGGRRRWITVDGDSSTTPTTAAVEGPAATASSPHPRAAAAASSPHPRAAAASPSCCRGRDPVARHRLLQFPLSHPFSASSTSSNGSMNLISL